MSGSLHMLKLSVGTDSVEDLAAWQASGRAATHDGLPRHRTRMWPRRAAELLDGGSIYWVIKGVILARQPILRLDEVTGEDGIPRCQIVLKPGLIRTAAVPRRPFQGWRYLPADEAPPDLSESRQREDALPPKLSAALAEIGVL
ncbi:DUF1489 family protein [Wenxinia saemankumensis]|uniref:Lysophospholipase n=1 Tax=Wenxinia saemankumensis TaxID=1447782 RepID=A0A1M6FH84_9RHOB|nr:DUF1489 domain-containing protein [Wenxinia saemankumensis]SHI97027.1 hypothetical protein SAMN05444417_2314 [Wenxinia saemankumensis]